MPNYRRVKLKGGTYFFTVNLQDRKQTHLTDHIDRLRQSLHHVKTKHEFHIDAAVILPDHLHMIWTLPENETDYSTRWRLIKHHFSRGLNPKANTSQSKRRNNEKGIWQRRFYEHCIRSDEDYEAHIYYIHFNPVKHGNVEKPIDWPYSTIHRFIANGIIEKHWDTNGIDTELNLD